MSKAVRLFILAWNLGLKKLVFQQGLYFYNIPQGSQIVMPKFHLVNAFL